ncbi:hypothetical protein ON010_g1809 [Phytophthora cinnamomi]|nr:hypothetical protein ON010_g1809 [Phytophthora cinnamomi]
MPLAVLLISLSSSGAMTNTSTTWPAVARDFTNITTSDEVEQTPAAAAVQLRAVVGSQPPGTACKPAQNRSRANFDTHGGPSESSTSTRDPQEGGFGAAEKVHSAITLRLGLVRRRCNVATGFVSLAVSLLVLMTG